MKKVFLILFACAFIFSFDLRALADEGHSHDQNSKKAAENFKNENTHTDMNHGNESNMEGMDHSSGSDMEGMDYEGGTDMEGMNHDSGSGHEDMDMNNESDHKSGHSHGPVVETPPNYKVLGTYGAVNLAFIAVGIWNKWFRRKGE